MDDAVDAANIRPFALELAAEVALDVADADLQGRRVLVDIFEKCTGGVAFALKEIHRDVL